MSKILKTVAIVAGTVALLATGIGAAIGPTAAAKLGLTQIAGIASVPGNTSHIDATVIEVGDLRATAKGGSP